MYSDEPREEGRAVMRREKRDHTRLYFSFVFPLFFPSYLLLFPSVWRPLGRRGHVKFMVRAKVGLTTREATRRVEGVKL